MTSTNQSQAKPTESDPLLKPSSNNEGDVEDPQFKQAENQDDDTPTTFLETVVEGVEHIAENVQEVATDIKDAIVEEAKDVKDTFVEELNEKDDGESFFFDMALTRNLSILPSDLEQATAVISETAEAPAKDDLKAILPETTKLTERDSTVVPFHAYLTLASAVIALSSIGPSLDLQHNVNATLKIFWRMSGTWMVLFPFALNAIRKEGMPQMTTTHWCTMGLAASCYAVMCVGFVIALKYTTVGNAVIFANSQAILLLLGKCLVGAPVMFLEGSGALIAFGGAVLCSLDAGKSDGTTGEMVASSTWAGWGDFLALIAGIGGVGYLVFAKSVRSNLNVYVFMFMNMVLASLATLTFMLVTGTEVTFDRDMHTGLFGFLNLQFDRLPLEIYTVCVCNMIGSLGYVRSMQYFDNIIISVATLLEPAVATFLALLLGEGALPGGLGWFGNALVAGGTTLVILPSSKKGSSSDH